MQRIYCVVLGFVGFGDETRVGTLCLHVEVYTGTEWTDSVPNVDSHLTPPPATPSGPPGQPGTRVVWPSPSVFGDLSPM